MALTTELLKGNAATAGLSDEQINAVVEMSKNDETTVIGQKTGEIYGGLDADILAASGIAKNGTEKTYDYAKRVIGEIKAQAGNATELQNQISELTKEKGRLEQVIAKGGADAETKRALEQAKADEGIRDFLCEIDLLIDGPYVEELDDNRMAVGSGNQRIILLTDRYCKVTEEYYGKKERQVEIRIFDGKGMLVGVPARDQKVLWRKLIGNSKKSRRKWGDKQ